MKLSALITVVMLLTNGVMDVAGTMKTQNFVETSMTMILLRIRIAVFVELTVLIHQHSLIHTEMDATGMLKTSNSVDTLTLKRL